MTSEPSAAAMVVREWLQASSVEVGHYLDPNERYTDLECRIAAFASRAAAEAVEAALEKAAVVAGHWGAADEASDLSIGAADFEERYGTDDLLAAIRSLGSKEGGDG